MPVLNKINEITPHLNDTISRSDLYRRYRRAFDCLLDLDDLTMPFGPRDMIYVHDEEFEDNIYSVIEDMNDTISIVIGYAGVGKSTSLRYKFGYYHPAPVFYKKNEKVLIFPSNFNGHLETRENYEGENCNIDSDVVRDDLRKRIESVCSFLESRCFGLKERFLSKEGQEEFYNYLKETNPKTLENLSFSDMMELNEEEQKKKRLEYAYNNEKFIFIATKLKYYMGCKECSCEKIILILDDIEPLLYDQQKALVMQYSRFISCMKNRLESISEKPFIINLIISMRPYTYRELNRDEAFRAFYITRQVYKFNTLDFGELLQKKIEYYSNEIPHKNKTSWNEACNILKILVGKFDSRYSEMVKNLNLWNIRDSINIFKSILMNRMWIQRNMEKTAAFSISEDNYIFNNITVLRAISCGSEHTYRYHLDNLVPNILQNSRNGRKNYCFIILSIMRHFTIGTSIENLYGSDPKEFGELCKMYCYMFPNKSNINQDVEYALNFLFYSKILLKGINDIKDEKHGEGKLVLQEGNLLYLSPRGYEVWNMLGSDSVYLELCREDIFRNYEGIEEFALSSYELMRTGKQEMIFVDLLRMLLELINEEENYVRYAIDHGTLPQYLNAFGNVVIGKILLSGIDNSIIYSCNGWRDDINEMRKNVIEGITHIEKMFDENS